MAKLLWQPGIGYDGHQPIQLFSVGNLEGYQLWMFFFGYHVNMSIKRKIKHVKYSTLYILYSLFIVYVLLKFKGCFWCFLIVCLKAIWLDHDLFVFLSPPNTSKNTTGGHRHRPCIFVTCRGGSGHANVDSYGSLVKGMLPEVTWDIYRHLGGFVCKWFCNSLYTSSTYYRFLLFEHVKHTTYCKLMNCCCFNSFWFFLLYSKLYLRNTYTNFLLDILSIQSTTHDYSGNGQCDGRNSSSDSFYYECQHQHYLGQDDCRLKIIIAQMRRMGLEYLPTFGLDLW